MEEQTERALLELTTQIVAAHVSNNTVLLSKVPLLINRLGLAYLAKGEGYLATRRGLEIRDQLTGSADHG